MSFFQKSGPEILLPLLLLLAALGLNFQAPTVLSEPCLPQLCFIISENESKMITNDLLKLARAMAEYEGWDFDGANPEDPKAGSRAWRNHNPGNLKKSPFAIATRDDFAVFINDETGFYALVWDIWQKAHGNTSTDLTGESSIYEFLKVYSGESDDEADRYARFVEKRTGILMSTPLRVLVEN